MSTDFQRSVWEAIKKIPRGYVSTYKKLAESIGKPAAVRAVATAVGKNPYIPNTPCHRVVRSDGSVGKYSGPGGVSAKMRLLEEEGVIINDGKIKIL